MRLLTITLAAGLLSIGSAHAVPTTIWAVDASATGSGVTNPAFAEQFSLTGALLQRVTLGSGFNPNGIAIIGNTGYVSSDGDGLLRTFNLVSGAVGASVATGQNALGALATDGTTIFATDFTGGRLLYQFATTGALLNITTLSLCGSYCNGLEFQAGSLLANEGQNVGPYDRYAPDGTVQQTSAFTLGDGGALAYNPDTGLRYAAVSGGSGGLAVSNGTTVTFGGTIADSGFGTSDRFINDLAFQVPEPTTLALLAGGLGLMAVRRRRA